MQQRKAAFQLETFVAAPAFAADARAGVTAGVGGSTGGNAYIAAAVIAIIREHRCLPLY